MLKNDESIFNPEYNQNDTKWGTNWKINSNLAGYRLNQRDNLMLSDYLELKKRIEQFHYTLWVPRIPYNVTMSKCPSKCLNF